MPINALDADSLTRPDRARPDRTRESFQRYLTSRVPGGSCGAISARGEVRLLRSRWLSTTPSGQSVGTNEWLESGVDLTFGTSSWHRYRDLPSLRRGGANHRVYRASGCDAEDPRPPEENARNLRILTITRKPVGKPLHLPEKTVCASTKCCCNAAYPASVGRMPAWSRSSATDCPRHGARIPSGRPHQRI
jgi:hypothetical protein